MKESAIEKKVGEKLRKIRKKKNLTQESLAALSGMHYTYIGQIERGERNITVKNLENLCSALNISMSEFFTDLSPKRWNQKEIEDLQSKLNHVLQLQKEINDVFEEEVLHIANGDGSDMEEMGVILQGMIADSV